MPKLPKLTLGWSPYLGLVTAILLSGLLLYRGNQRNANAFTHEPVAPEEVVRKSKIRFKEVSQAKGIRFQHILYYPHKDTEPGSVAESNRGVFPSIAIADINADGFMDILVTQASPESANHVYKNIDGKDFIEASAPLGLSELDDLSPTSSVLVADLNKDSRLDIVFSKYGCHQAFLQDSDGYFKRARFWFNGYCSNARSLNLFDYDLDGNLDAVFANYWPAINLREEIPRHFLHGSFHHGGINHVLKGDPESGFQVKFILDGDNHTNSVGITDVNLDGYPDIFFGNDYAFDQLFINERGDYFIERTDHYIPRSEHGFAGMNADFNDFDGDGDLDLYVTNIHKPPYVREKNVLWLKEGKKYVSAAAQLGVARCGFSWGAKFADFDNNGEMELFVSNGKARGRKTNTESKGKSFWFERFLYRSIPLAIREYEEFNVHYSFDKMNQSGFERSCLFEKIDGRYADVAQQAGFQEIENGRGVGIIDFNNDGKLDIAVVNYGGPLLLYENKSESMGSWIGFLLVGKDGAPLPLGAKVELIHADGRRMYRELYPMNGFNSQSDPRIHFGLGDIQDLSTSILRITWPDQTISEFDNLKINQYQEIRRR